MVLALLPILGVMFGRVVFVEEKIRETFVARGKCTWAHRRRWHLGDADVLARGWCFPEPETRDICGERHPVSSLSSASRAW